MNTIHCLVIWTRNSDILYIKIGHERHVYIPMCKHKISYLFGSFEL